MRSGMPPVGLVTVSRLAAMASTTLPTADVICDGHGPQPVPPRIRPAGALRQARGPPANLAFTICYSS